MGTVVVLTTVVANCLWGKKSSKKSKKLVTLVDPNTKYALPLIEREELSHDTRRFRFGLPSKEHVLGKNNIILILTYKPSNKTHQNFGKLARLKAKGIKVLVHNVILLIVWLSILVVFYII